MYGREGDFGKYIYGGFFRVIDGEYDERMVGEVLQYNISRI